MIVALPQTLVVVLAPPSPFNRLFVLTGTAVEGVPALGPRDDDNFTRETMVVDLTQWHGGQRLANLGDSHLMILSAELAVLQRGNQRHASRYSNFVACAEWVGYRERK
jgi:hypothetical protein